MKFRLVKSPVEMSSFDAFGDKILYGLVICALCYGALNLAPGLRLFTSLFNVIGNMSVSYAAVPIAFAIVLMPVMVIVRKMEKSL